MKKSRPKANDAIHRLRQQINLEDDRGKLRELVFRLQIALNEEGLRKPTKLTTPARTSENPFDSVIPG